MKNKKILISNFLFVHCKKHFCPQCSNQLKVVKVRETVNKNNYNVNDVDISNGDVFFVGDVDIVYEKFYCPKCNLKYNIKDIKYFEHK